MLVMDSVHPLEIIFVLQQTIHSLMAGTSPFEWAHRPPFLSFSTEKNKPSFFLSYQGIKTAENVQNTRQSSL